MTTRLHWWIFILYMAFTSLIFKCDYSEASDNAMAYNNISSINKIHEAVVKNISNEMISKMDYQSKYMSSLSLAVAVITVLAGILGVMLAINILYGKQHLKDVENEFKELKSLKDSYSDNIKTISETQAKLFASKLKMIEEQVSNEVNKILDKEIKINFIKRDKQNLIDELNEESIDDKYIYKLLSKIASEYDAETEYIYQKCDEKLNGNKDIMRLVANGRANASFRTAGSIKS